jgi:hypothetical protein
VPGRKEGRKGGGAGTGFHNEAKQKRRERVEKETESNSPLHYFFSQPEPHVNYEKETENNSPLYFCFFNQNFRIYISPFLSQIHRHPMYAPSAGNGQKKNTKEHTKKKIYICMCVCMSNV